MNKTTERADGARTTKPTVKWISRGDAIERGREMARIMKESVVITGGRDIRIGFFRCLFCLLEAWQLIEAIVHPNGRKDEVWR